MKDLSVLIVASLVAIAVFCYCRKVYKKEAAPALSSWLIFFTATFLSSVSYIASEGWDWKSGILNLSDMAGDLIILVFVLICGSKLKERIKPFEKKYLAGAIGIVLFWIFSKDAFVSNLLIQLLLVVGYLPIIQNLLKEEKNTEPMFGWLIIFSAAILASYPAVTGGNLLAVIYAGKSIVMIKLVLILMISYEIKNNKGAS